MSKIATPELDKMIACKDRSQIIGEFLEWLGTSSEPICLCYYDEDMKEYCDVSTPINSILAEYFGIDENKCEKERQAILADLRQRPEKKK